MADLTAGAAPRCGPATIVRRCRLPAGLVRRFGDTALWDLAGDLAAARDAVGRRGAALADLVGSLVPAADPAARRALLRLRRDAFNGRRPRPADTERPEVPAEELTAYQDVLSTADRLTRQVDAALRDQDAATAAALADLLADPDFAASVDLSVPELTRTGQPDAGRGARHRRRTLTLLRMALRAATKPSPLARFTECELVVPGAAHRAPAGRIRFQSDLLRDLTTWAAAAGPPLVRADHLWLTTNPTLRIVRDGGHVRMHWLVTDDDRRERVVTAECPAALESLVTALRMPATLSAVAGPVPGVPRQIAALVDRGVLELGVRPDHGNVLDAVHDALDPECEQARAVAGLRGLAADWTGRAGGSRADLVSAASEAAARLATALGRPQSRLVVTEDLHGTRPADDADPPVDTATACHLALLQRLLPLLGAELPFQLADAVSFRAVFGTDAVPLVAAYRWYAEHGRAASERLLAGCDHPVLRETIAVRTAVFDRLWEIALAAGGDALLDPRWIEEVADSMPGSVARWGCVAWLVQRAGGLVVLNGATTGYARLAARLSAAAGPGGRASLREWARTADTDPADGLVVDIAATFGAVVNERAPLLPATLGFPGAALECDPDARIDPATCTVRVAPDAERLLLESEQVPGRPLLPVPHNGTLPSLGPPFYRWLVRFGPSLGSTLALWDRVDERHARPGVRRYPRLRLGDVVVDRATWKVPAAALPETDGTPIADLLAWHRWCARTGVPRRAFVRRSTLPDPWDVVRGRADGGRLAVARSRAGDAARKPMYVDLSQPLCWPRAGSPGDGPITFTEPLPDPALTAADGHTTEFVIETAQPCWVGKGDRCAATVG